MIQQVSTHTAYQHGLDS